MTPLHLLELLVPRGFDPTRPGKLVRHQDHRYDLREILARGWFEAYQSFQSRRVFENCEQIVSFLGEPGGRARLLGIYEVQGRSPALDSPLPPACPYEEWRKLGHRYNLVRRPGFENLEQRLVIVWGRGARSWHQRLRDKEVVEYSPRRTVREPFTDYLDFSLSFSELVSLVEEESNGGEWKSRLSAVAGIYLIVSSTGELYVGSAHGEQGIWGRWTEYVRTGHGGNRLLKDLIKQRPEHPSAFRFSVLQVFPKTYARDEVVTREALYKEKLGSRSHGLNLN